MADRDAAIEEIVKTAYAIAKPHDDRFKFISLIQMTNDELHRARQDVLVEQINWCYQRLGYLSSQS
jgi:hypothetical protein